MHTTSHSLSESTVLVVDDEASLRSLLRIVLESVSYKVIESETGADALRIASMAKPRLILLDLGLPDMDGKDVIAAIRTWSQLPIIVCSVRGDEQESVQALRMGADDYVTKPFSADVLLARIEASLRKTQPAQDQPQELVNGSIRMDLMRHEVFVGDERVVLTPKEFALLRCFLSHAGKVLTHQQILKEVWGAAHRESVQYLRVYVNQLRSKIEPDSAHPMYVLTEPSIGYRMAQAA